MYSLMREISILSDLDPFHKTPLWYMTKATDYRLLGFGRQYEHVKTPWRCLVRCAGSSILLLRSMTLLVLHLLQSKDSWLNSGGSSSLLWSVWPYLNSFILWASCLKLERTPTPEILKMTLTFYFCICTHAHCVFIHSGQRLTWDSFFYSPPYCFILTNLFFDNFIHVYNVFWSYSSPQPFLTPCHLHLKYTMWFSSIYIDFGGGTFFFLFFFF